MIEPLGPPERLLGTGFGPQSFLKNLSTVVLDDLRERRACLLIFYAHESFNFNQSGIFDELYRQLDEIKIDPTQVILVSGNCRANENHKEWLGSHTHQNRIEVIEFSLFVILSQCNYNHYQYPYDLSSMFAKLEDHLDRLMGGHKKKKFLCFNRIPKPARWTTVCWLQMENLLKDGYVSLFPESDFGGYVSDFKDLLSDDPILLEKLAQQINTVRAKLPLTIDIDSGSLNKAYTNQACGRADHSWPYLNSYFSLVSETWVDSDTLFLTEKTYKPIANFHPFIVLGNPGSLNLLKRQGFQTFAPLIDETYDDEPVFSKRFMMVAGEVKRLCAMDGPEINRWFLDTVPILRHNYEVLFSKRIKETFGELVKQILNHKGFTKISNDKTNGLYV